MVVAGSTNCNCDCTQSSYLWSYHLLVNPKRSTGRAVLIMARAALFLGALTTRSPAFQSKGGSNASDRGRFRPLFIASGCSCLDHFQVQRRTQDRVTALGVRTTDLLTIKPDPTIAHADIAAEIWEAPNLN